MKILKALSFFFVTLILVACGKTDDYSPSADASGEEIFGAVCTQCHTPISADVVMVLSKNVATQEGIVNKVQSGSMRMPAFPNIQGEAATRLADYVLTHSQEK